MSSAKNNRKLKDSAFLRFVKQARPVLLFVAGALITAFLILPGMLRGQSVPEPASVTLITPEPTQAPQVTAVIEPTPEETVAEPVQENDTPVQNTPVQDAPKYAALKFEDTDPVVMQIQERLAELGYLDGDEPTDYFGPATQAAIKLFQRAHYMTQTGIADELTQSILFSDNAKTYVLEKGNSGDDVQTLQERLNDLGYYSDKQNGYFGTATVRALSAFQTKNKLSSDGIAGQETLDLIYSSKAKPKVDPTPTPKPRTPKPVSTPKPGSTAKSPSGGGSSSISVTAEKSASGLISVAKAQLGEPYVWSNEGPDSFDCSGLVYYSLRSVGVSIGRYSASSYSKVSSWTTVSFDQLAPGDLIFFRSDSSERVSHTGIWLGGNSYIHASSSAGKVVISSWSNWAKRNFVNGKRVF